MYTTPVVNPFLRRKLKDAVLANLRAKADGALIRYQGEMDYVNLIANTVRKVNR